MGIKVLPPNVNESEQNFAAQGDDVILFGLSAVRNVGTNVVESIIKSRKAKGSTPPSRTTSTRSRPSPATSAPRNR